jgi:hypothetical protein
VANKGVGVWRRDENGFVRGVVSHGSRLRTEHGGRGILHWI